ncbi:type IV-A pilus assembly ATPase PilB [Simonsiella muelleri]|uniref:Type IV-A pilus assembly ATPase PilB n=1 Tax=Simonsiella muelleri ATCC 29453 TaxID=641147 RepID=V9H6S8_9NEIS|nr:type IV-A pilus assembly ATPase PilB [Simonsiella muelleri]AUX60490.1 type IV-A pilus assembly ATPase PilB [Simonsiella muelleri ATCC 29453]EFG31980.1 type IV-A pilus assembly ATPase PilB [Simonsiella muelleri ATCC 29453]UBQ54687.1 type IV-A pilus assembly ATPase PilB [Simonsiella muelleri]
MSIGLLRLLKQEGLIPSGKVEEKYRKALDNNKNIIPMFFDDKVIAPEDLASLVSRVFNYPQFDLRAFPARKILTDVMEEAQIQENRCIPIFKRGKRVFVAVSDPTILQNVQKFVFNSGLSPELVIVRDDQLDSMLEQFSQSNTALIKEMGMDANLQEAQAETMIVSGEEEDDGPIAKFIQKVLFDAVNTGASDIHFEFYEFMARVRYRTDGVLREVVQPPLALRNNLASRIKVMAKLDISEKRIPQDGRIQLQFSKGSKAIDFRVSTMPCLFGEKVVMRILNSDAGFLNINQLGFEDFQKDLILEAIHRPYGMVLVTGPTGSGKTVSLYTCLNILNTDDVNISTAEDPAEINLPGINQVNVNDKQGLTFEAALKAFLRQDPDIIMIGEIRDLGTADIAIKAAQTGHMVFSTLHTNNAPATLSRMLNMGVAPFNIASAVNLIMAQRLARRLCSNCKAPMERPPEKVLREAGFTDEDLAGNWTMYRAVGCEACKGKGYKGRAGLYEVMPMTERMKAVIMKGGTEVDIANIAYEEGLVDLRRSGLLKVMQGITTLEEVLATTNEG